MAGKPQVTLTATAPDGVKIHVRTAAGYDWAGITQQYDGTWILLAKGWAYHSVEARTRQAWRRSGGWDSYRGWKIVPFEVQS